GYRAALTLEDALAPDVLLADRLAGAPLGPDHGHPLRVVAPAHYGFKSVKHLDSIEFRIRWPKTSAPLDHRRARVELEERGSYLPRHLLRYANRTSVPLLAWVGRRALSRSKR